MYNIEGKKAVALYRVSTIKQTNDEKDIPAQKELVRQFIEREGLILIREFTEGGVSGFKTKVDDRDALVSIKELAKNNEFDILVVYKSDRIGRTTDESPLVIKYLNDNNIRVFTTDIGEIKTESQMDKLMTYLMFWQNETESVKISQRATDYQVLLIQNGRWRGGGKQAVPFGYKLIDNGLKNNKGKTVWDLAVDDEQAITVKKIYELSIDANMGTKSIARYLNEHHYPAKSKNGWNYSTVNVILNNSVYKGYLYIRSKLKNETIMSPKRDDLVIISEERWEQNQRMLEERKCSKGKKTEGGTSEHVLLNGLTYCGYCENRLTPWANHKKRKNKNNEEVKYIQYYYRCLSSIQAKDVKCEGQTSYSASRIERAVEEETKDFLITVYNKALTKEFRKELKNNVDKLVKLKNQLEKEIEEKHQEYQIYKKEVANSIVGKSKFTSELLNELMDENKSEQDKILQKLSDLDKEILSAKNLQDDYLKLNDSFQYWYDNFDKLDFVEKKQMYRKIIDKVIVYKDTIRIVYKVEIDNFINNSGCKTSLTGLPAEPHPAKNIIAHIEGQVKSFLNFFVFHLFVFNCKRIFVDKCRIKYYKHIISLINDYYP